ncbi:hypothetical protein CO180_04440 [candidate division WWE3 bacterium CG_4_9_14_3_um_filter_41_6]|uniref:Uncharacterized protein n=1 Tax=candidate division WWE3 bacterium CG_4_10_14_0_2_um_filter_41_14 TaxID=1975072 RepID=A0A2M7TF73_UNCKA|nr:MAG: hypothetical protein COY32_06325 [candidate division WWE3 bacterium CG_4_10_14_0_2_um_filter_41_14]PJA38042.1 MAG: hypothetical protein CO180_04440 [candidate division WWE3 bacterium CG_4_9_14_3_um_filter_41_6]
MKPYSIIAAVKSSQLKNSRFHFSFRKDRYMSRTSKSNLSDHGWFFGIMSRPVGDGDSIWDMQHLLRQDEAVAIYGELRLETCVFSSTGPIFRLQNIGPSIVVYVMGIDYVCRVVTIDKGKHLDLVPGESFIYMGRSYELSASVGVGRATQFVSWCDELDVPSNAIRILWADKWATPCVRSGKVATVSGSIDICVAQKVSGLISGGADIRILEVGSGWIKVANFSL